MKILLLTPGTGSFYCGSCMRDNALAKAMRRLGHDVTMLPMYLPLTLDESNADPDQPVFFGGVNVYLQEKVPLFRWTPRFVDRMLDSPRLLRWLGGKAGSTSAKALGKLTLSMLQGEHGHQRKELQRLVTFLQSEQRADVVMLNNALLMGLAREIRERTGAAVLCTLQGEDVFLDSLPRPWRDRCWQELRDRVEVVDAFVAVSGYYGDVMQQRMAIPDDKLKVVHNGIDLSGYEAPSSPPGVPTVGYLARIHSAKGALPLAKAFAKLKQQDWATDVRLHMGGSLTPADEPLQREIADHLEQAGVAEHVAYHHNMTHEQKLDFLRGLTVLSVPSTYGESFGLYVVEAMAAGVPVVQPRCAAFPELVDRGGGVLYEPDDEDAHVDALAKLLRDEALHAKLSGKARASAEYFSVERMAREVAEVCEGVCRQVPAPAGRG